MKNACIIPARSGSKRIPGKNTKNFLGKPVITYVITEALKSGIFDEVIVSTDSREIAEVAEKAGASVPFLRSNAAASDTANTVDVLTEVLAELGKLSKYPAYACCLYPTSVFATAKKITGAYKLLNENKFDAVISVQKYEHPIQRAFSLKNGKAAMLWPENMFKRTQDLDPSFHDAAQFYWIETSSFTKNKSLFTPNTGAIEFAEWECHDIDYPEDWLAAENKFQGLKYT